MIRFSNRDRQTSFLQSSCVSVMTQRSEINEVFRGNQLQKIISILSNTLLPKRVSFASFWLCFISYRKDMLKHYSPNNLRAIVLSFHLGLQGKQGSITQLKKIYIFPSLQIDAYNWRISWGTLKVSQYCMMMLWLWCSLSPSQIILMSSGMNL